MKKFKNYPDLAVSLLVDLKDKIGGDKVWDSHFYKTIPNYYQEGDPVGNPYRSEQAIQRAQAETIRESQMQVNRDGSVTPGAVSKVTQEVQN